MHRQSRWACLLFATLLSACATSPEPPTEEAPVTSSQPTAEPDEAQTANVGEVHVLPYEHSVVVEDDEELGFVPALIDLVVHLGHSVSTEIAEHAITCSSQTMAYSSVRVEANYYEGQSTVDLQAACRLMADGSLCLRTLLTLDDEPAEDSGWDCRDATQDWWLAGDAADDDMPRVLVTVESIALNED